MRRVHGLLVGVAAMIANLPAHASTPLGLPHVAVRMKKPPTLAAGAPGTIGWAIAEHDKKVHGFKRPLTEGAVPEINPDGTCPPEMSNIDGRFCVDRWEGSLVEVAADGATQAWAPTTILDLNKNYRAVSVADVVPQSYISGSQALDACKAAGKRLCEAAEWRLACTGPEGTIYPYGTTRVDKRCNDYGKAPMYVFYPQVERSWAGVTNTDMNDPRLNLLENTIAKTGAHKDCVNDYGLYDMVGNLHEWTADPNGTFQGGYYLDTMINGEGCAYRTTAHDFDYHDYSTGFRCCSDLRPRSEDE
jgi:hypothetical protein